MWLSDNLVSTLAKNALATSLLEDESRDSVAAQKLLIGLLEKEFKKKITFLVRQFKPVNEESYNTLLTPAVLSLNRQFR